MAGKTTKKTASINQKVEAIRRFFADSKAANHPIKEHPVSKAEEYVRDLYLDMLCVVAQYESTDTENAFTLIRRIMAACMNPQQLEEYIKRSMEITPERTAEFIKQCKDNGLCEIFMVDSMLLSCSNGTPNGKQVDFLTQFGDMLGFERIAMADMAKFTLAILEQDSEGYQALFADDNEAIQFHLVCYAKEFVNGLLIDTSEMIYYHYVSKSLESIRLEKNRLIIENKKLIIFENITFSGIEITCSYAEKLRFINCSFTDYMKFEPYIISAYSIESLEMTGCQFKDIYLVESYAGYVLHFSNINHVLFSDVSVSNVSKYSACEYTSGVFCYLVADVNSFKMSHCEFSNCSLINTRQYCCYNIAYVSDKNVKCIVEHSKFFSCHGGNALFSGDANKWKFTKNEFIDCVKITE